MPRYGLRLRLRNAATRRLRLSAGGTNPTLRPGDTDKAARLEAVLLLAREPLSVRRLAQLADLEDATEARTLLRMLNLELDEHAAAVRVEAVAGGYRLLTRPQFFPWLRRLHPDRQETRLSPPALETLAVVAYRQPVLRAEIEAVRGVQCGEILRQLMERDLVRIAGKSNELGRPFLYGTTRKFLECFGLRDLEELPRADLLRRAGASAEVAADPSPAEEAVGIAEFVSHQKESDVKAVFAPSLVPAEDLEDETLPLIRNKDEEEEDEDDEDFEDEDDEDFEDDEEDEEIDDEEEEDLDEDEDDLDDEEEDEWEEVDDDDEEWDEEDEEGDEEEDEEDEEEWEDEDEEEWDEDEDEEEEEEAEDE